MEPGLPAGPQPIYKSRKLQPAGSHHPNWSAQQQNNNKHNLHNIHIIWGHRNYLQLPAPPHLTLPTTIENSQLISLQPSISTSGCGKLLTIQAQEAQSINKII